MRVLLTTAALAVAWTAGAQGTSEFEAIRSHTNSIPVVTSVRSTAGWTFQPTNFITVFQLGCFNDVFLTNQNLTAIQVGLWTHGGSLLASNSVTSGSLLFDQTRYESVTPVALTPGQLYHIGAYSLDGEIGVEVCGQGVGGFVATDPGFAVGASAINVAGFGYPPEVAGTGGLLYLVPNVRYRPTPEPSSVLLLALGALLLAGRRRNWLP